MSILVTGGAGYIGSHLVLELVNTDETVVVIDNLSTGFGWAIAEGAQLIVGDVGDEALVEAVIGENKVDSIIHCAGSIVVPESVADPLKYYLNNTAKSRALINAAVRSGVPNMIFSSTAAVYDMINEMPVAETAPLNPASPYGSSKLMTEIMLRDVAAAHPSFRYVSLRYFNVAGADPKGRAGQSTKGATHLIKVACETALGKRPFMEVYGTDYPTPDGTCIRDYIHVTDLARAHNAALTYLRCDGRSEVFNCGYGIGYSVIDVIDAVRKSSRVSRELDVRYAQRRAGDPPTIVSANAKIKTTLNWRPSLDNLSTIVDHALAWECELAERLKRVI